MGSSGCFGVWKGRGPRSEKFTPMTRHNIYWDIPNSKPSQLGLSRYHPWKNRSNSNWHLHHITSRLTLQSTHYITGYTLHHDLHDRQKRSRLATIEREISFEVIVGVQVLSITEWLGLRWRWIGWSALLVQVSYIPNFLCHALNDQAPCVTSSAVTRDRKIWVERKSYNNLNLLRDWSSFSTGGSDRAIGP